MLNFKIVLITVLCILVLYQHGSRLMETNMGLRKIIKEQTTEISDFKRTQVSNVVGIFTETAKVERGATRDLSESLNENQSQSKSQSDSSWVVALEKLYLSCRAHRSCHLISKMGMSEQPKNVLKVRPPQGFQALILHQIFQNVIATEKYFVEFGFDASNWTGGGGSNTGYLKFLLGWDGLLLDGSHSNKAMNLHNHLIHPETIISLFHKYEVPADVDYISIDLDSTDIFVLHAILEDDYYKPKVISVEYNCYFPHNSTIANAGYEVKRAIKPNLDLLSQRKYYVANIIAAGARFHGTSLKNIFLAAEKFGYKVVAVDTSYDAFLVRADLLGDIETYDHDHYERASAHFRREPKNKDGSGKFSGHPVPKFMVEMPDRCWCMGWRQHWKKIKKIRTYIVNYENWMNNGHNMTKANGDNGMGGGYEYGRDEIAKYGMDFNQTCYPKRPEIKDERPGMNVEPLPLRSLNLITKPIKDFIKEVIAKADPRELHGSVSAGGGGSTHLGALLRANKNNVNALSGVNGTTSGGNNDSKTYS